MTKMPWDDDEVVGSTSKMPWEDDEIASHAPKMPWDDDEIIPAAPAPAATANPAPAPKPPRNEEGLLHPSNYNPVASYTSYRGGTSPFPTAESTMASRGVAPAPLPEKRPSAPASSPEARSRAERLLADQEIQNAEPKPKRKPIGAAHFEAQEKAKLRERR